MTRKKWRNMNGLWSYAILAKDSPMPDFTENGNDTAEHI